MYLQGYPTVPLVGQRWRWPVVWTSAESAELRCFRRIPSAGGHRESQRTLAGLHHNSMESLIRSACSSTSNWDKKPLASVSSRSKVSLHARRSSSLILPCWSSSRRMNSLREMRVGSADRPRRRTCAPLHICCMSSGVMAVRKFSSTLLCAFSRCLVSGVSATAATSWPSARQPNRPYTARNSRPGWLSATMSPRPTVEVAEMAKYTASPQDSCGSKSRRPTVPIRMMRSRALPVKAHIRYVAPPALLMKRIHLGSKLRRRV
eukprot:scaffold69_cov248-Pinguiococcus_pyrenoidosus.AAC.58